MSKAISVNNYSALLFTVVLFFKKNNNFLGSTDTALEQDGGL